MSFLRLTAPCLLNVMLAAAAQAEAPAVATDIPPVHSLVARVMEGVGSPALIVSPGASPHGYSLRPSQAGILQQADLVVWTGAELTPWLAGPISALAGKAASLELLEIPGTTLLEYREGAMFQPHDHGDHDHDHDHSHDHGHDPHAWLDPQNAALWLGAIAAQLSELDPENAPLYDANAKAGQQEIGAMTDSIKVRLAPVQGKPFLVFHDAYHYFENRFGIAAAGAISLADASDPSPARIARIRAMVADLGVVCAFSEPQFNPGLIRTVFEGAEAKTGVIDPLGAGLEPGPALYQQMLQGVADSLADCLQ